MADTEVADVDMGDAVSAKRRYGVPRCLPVSVNPEISRSFSCKIMMTLFLLVYYSPPRNK